MKSYKKLINILNSMPRLESVMLTFQDNFINKEKVTFLDENFSMMRLKSLTLRNLSYFIWPKQKVSIKLEKIE